MLNPRLNLNLALEAPEKFFSFSSVSNLRIKRFSGESTPVVIFDLMNYTKASAIYLTYLFHSLSMKTAR